MARMQKIWILRAKHYKIILIICLLLTFHKITIDGIILLDGLSSSSFLHIECFRPLSSTHSYSLYIVPHDKT
jgi:hypothetical protein